MIDRSLPGALPLPLEEGARRRRRDVAEVHAHDRRRERGRNEGARQPSRMSDFGQKIKLENYCNLDGLEYFVKSVRYLNR